MSFSGNCQHPGLLSPFCLYTCTISRGLKQTHAPTLSSYLESRGASFTVSTYDTWRNYTLVNISGIFGPMLAGWMCNQPILGRRYTMVIGALVTSAFFFAYTAVRTPQENVGFSCAIGFCLNVYYGTLYAYTPEGMWGTLSRAYLSLQGAQLNPPPVILQFL